MDEYRALHDSLPHLGSTGRESVEGGAPYMHEYGLPQYPPDEYDTRFTYPLDLCSKLVDGVATVPTKASSQDAANSTEPDIMNSELEPPATVPAVSYLIPIEKAVRACGIIERSWIHYALHVHGDYTLLAEREDPEEINSPPPYRFMVAPMLYTYVAFDSDGTHLLDDASSRAYTFGT
jgi:hypothetical protein